MSSSFKTLLIVTFLLATKEEIEAFAKCNKTAFSSSISESFLVIGHAGGNPTEDCENTLTSTRSALVDGGANAIELDLSVSLDGIVFLWHDPEPNSPESVIRR